MMNKVQTFQEFLATQTTHIPLAGFFVNLILSAILGVILGRIYIVYGKSLSNRKLFAHNFLLIIMTTTVIITIVKSSLALSLGLVGALSIVRFRTAIKEPEELAYLFLSIAIGLGLGADQRMITIIAFVVIGGIIAIKGYIERVDESHNLYLTVSNNQSNPVTLEQIVKILEKSCSDIQLRRIDDTEEVLEASFLVAYNNFEQLKQTIDTLRKLNKTMKITFLDNQGIG